MTVHTIHEAATLQEEGIAVPEPRYLLGPGDVLRATFVGETALDSNVKVSPDGRVLLPLLDQPILAAGLTLEELQSAIVDSLTRYLVDPQVFVHLVELGSQHVFVLGEVRTPQLAKSEPLTLAGAIAACGGLTPDGQKKQVIVIRRVPGQDPVVFDINFSKLLKGESLLPDIPLQRYDIVVVPKSRVANLRDFVDAAFGNSLVALRFGLDAIVFENALSKELNLYYSN
ncbi:MAG: polysaccharide biosynthesis/export family protein [Candidatus Krumholzibacteriia bacterium]|nr:polysaccharide export protein [Candidatus Latescibacterota bacterium]